MAAPQTFDSALDSLEETVFTASPTLQMSDAERLRLRRQFQPLIARLISHYSHTLDEKQEIEAEINLIFCQLLDQYDPLRGVPLLAYLVKQLSYRTYSFTRKLHRQSKREISMEEFIGSDRTQFLAGRRETFVDQLIDQNARSEFMAYLHEAMEHLTERQRFVIKGRYFESRSFEEMARELKVAPATVRSLLRHGIDNLRKRLQHHRSSL